MHPYIQSLNKVPILSFHPPRIFDEFKPYAKEQTRQSIMQSLVREEQLSGALLLRIYCFTNSAFLSALPPPIQTRKSFQTATLDFEEEEEFIAEEEEEAAEEGFNPFASLLFKNGASSNFSNPFTSGSNQPLEKERKKGRR